jgi:micrococcal nuclease
MDWLRILLLPAMVHVIDGDTVRQHGVSIRLQGFNTPELHAQCADEERLARRAKARLEALVREGATLTINHGRCGYGRRCGSMLLHGRDVGDILIAEGLAEPYVCVDNRCPRRRSWCASNPGG